MLLLHFLAPYLFSDSNYKFQQRQVFIHLANGAPVRTTSRAVSLRIHHVRDYRLLKTSTISLMACVAQSFLLLSAVFKLIHFPSFTPPLRSPFLNISVCFKSFTHKDCIVLSALQTCSNMLDCLFYDSVALK